MEHLSAFEKQIYNIMLLRKKFQYLTLAINFLLLVVFAIYYFDQNTIILGIFFGCLALWLGYYVFKFIYIRKRMRVLSGEFKVIKEHKAAEGTNFAVGEPIQVGDESDKYQGWYMCTGENGSGYIHARYIYKNKKGEAFAKGKFTSRELEVNEGDLVTVSGYASSWIYVKKGEEEEGWILADCIEA